MFIITRIDVKTNRCNIISSHNDIRDAYYGIKQQIKSDNCTHQKVYCNFVEEYTVLNGIFITSKELKYIYEIKVVPQVKKDDCNKKN